MAKPIQFNLESLTTKKVSIGALKKPQGNNMMSASLNSEQTLWSQFCYGLVMTLNISMAQNRAVSKNVSVFYYLSPTMTTLIIKVLM